MNAIPPLPVAVPELIAQIIFALCQTLTERLRMGSLTPAGLTYIVGRLLGIRKRFRRLVARINAGKLPKELTRKPRPVRAAPEADSPLGFRPPPPGWRRWAERVDKPVPLWRSMHQNFAWLLPLAPSVPEFRDSAVAHRAEIRRLLEAPEMRALLLTSRRVGDTLRPLCWMLGIEASLLNPTRPVACAAVLAPDRLDPAPDQDAASNVAGPEPMLADPTALPSAWPHAGEGGDFFAMA